VGDAVALLGRARCVLFDFDGPVAHLFGRHPAFRIADALRRRAEELGLPASELRGVSDPLRVLRIAAGLDRSGRIASQLEERLSREEVRAAATAPPTPYADRLVRSLVGSGRQIAITTNNSARAAAAYLERRNLGRHFGPHVHGRATDPALLKPHPDCLRRAMVSTGTAAADCLMIGDSPADFVAADSAGVPFLGYARNDRKAEALRRAGAEHVVRSLEDLLAAAAGA
jgi:beta-phosphoglucomutase-like phosphatase (HAD superfamily)